MSTFVFFAETGQGKKHSCYVNLLSTGKRRTWVTKGACQGEDGARMVKGGASMEGDLDCELICSARWFMVFSHYIEFLMKFIMI